MHAPVVYVVEDDAEIRGLVLSIFHREGFAAEGAPDAATFWDLYARAAPDLVVLDIMMPGEDGLSVCRKLRRHTDTPVIVASARGEALDRIIGLEIGADDYLAKPFHPRELVARARAVLRRGERALPPAGRLIFGEWCLDTGSRELEGPDGPLELTSGEYALLSALLSRPREVLSRDALMDALKGREADAYDRSIDIQISRLRRKLGDDPRRPRLIRTVRNGGYMLVVPVTRAEPAR